MAGFEDARKPQPGWSRLPLWTWIAVFLVLIGLILGFGKKTLLLWMSGAVAPGRSVTPSPEPTLDFTLRDLEGNEVALSVYRGKLVLLNFWATWCPSCKEEMGLLDSYYREHQQQDFVLLSVNVSDRPPDAALYVQEQGYTFPLLFDPAGRVLVELDAYGLPISLLVDPEGHLLKRWVGSLGQSILDTEVTPYLE